MKILVIGSGGREHALAWKLAQSSRVTEVIVAPGNAGTASEDTCRNVAVKVTDIDGLLALAQAEGVALTVVGPEVPLVAGVVDRFRAAGLRIFGPTAAAAQLEGSKAYAKDFLARHNIPTAYYAVHSDVDAALAYVREKGAPIVVKADGLAAGKGVIVAMSLTEAEDAVQETLLRAYQHRESYDPRRARLTTWVHRIAHNVCVDEHRAARRRREARRGGRFREWMTPAHGCG